MKKFFSKLVNNFPKDWPTRIILILILGLSVAGAIFGYRLTRDLVSSNETFSLPGDPVIGNDPAEEDQSVDATPAPTEVLGAALPTPEPWDGVSRVTILVMGLDYREWSAGEIPHSDTMILFTMDPLNQTAAIVSIPRDIWVSVPGYDYEKINTAYYLGELNNLPGGGAALAARTVEEFLGIPVDYYAQVDFQAFIDFIDDIQGVRLDIKEPITIDRLGQWNTVTLEPGLITLPGDYALAYVRTRYTEGGDFDRASRQQEVIMAIRDRILEFDMLPTLVANAPQIYEDLAGGINTNMSLSQVIKLAWSAMDIDRENIQQVIISNEYITLGKSPTGLDILIPIPDKIRLLRDEIFDSGGAIGPVAEGDLLSLVVEENARVSVRNGSYLGGLAATTAEWMRGQGVNVVEETNADYTVYSSITIYNATPYALKWLSQTMNINSNMITYAYDPNASVDLVVVLGDDWAGNNPME
ncbi:MAG: LCP family protein [Anaerolineaceae bacterium]|nr:LCP family protein [Anaerolineaceae bacterium]